MIAVRRLLAVTAFVAVAAVLSCSWVLGEPGQDKELKDYRKGGKNHKPVGELKGRFAEDLQRNRFADQPIITYHDGSQTFFALQLLPNLPDAPVLPIDYLVVIDTSASLAKSRIFNISSLSAIWETR